MVANTGTYVDVPFHRFADGKDLREVGIEALAHLPAIVVRQPFEYGLAVDAAAFDGLDVRGKAVLVATGWDRHWGTDAYYSDHPFLTARSRRAGWSAMAPRWSGSTATISTTRAPGRGRSIPRCSARKSRSASI